MQPVPVWGCGPFDNEHAIRAAARLIHPPLLRSELARSLHDLDQHPGDPQYVGYAAAEIVAAAGALHPYWQSDVPMHPAAITGREGTGVSFYLPPEIDEWIRLQRPAIPADITADALQLVNALLEHCDLWPDEDNRQWYLHSTLLHLESALDRVVVAAEESDDDVF